MLRAYSEGEFPLGLSAEKLLRFAAAKKSSDKQPHFFEGALPVQTDTLPDFNSSIFFWCKEMDSLFTIFFRRRKYFPWDGNNWIKEVLSNEGKAIIIPWALLKPVYTKLK